MSGSLRGKAIDTRRAMGRASSALHHESIEPRHGLTRTLYVCQGPECARQGSQALLLALYVAHGPTCTDGRLVIRASGCRSRCTEAVTLGLFPERLFLQHASLEQAEAILFACLEPAPPGPPWERALADRGP